jgi:hypothetical protein
VLGEEVGAIRKLLSGDDGGLHWLLTQPARCANDAVRVAMTISSQGIVLQCPRCQKVAAWASCGDGPPDSCLGA